MFDFLLTDSQQSLRDEVRDFVAWVPRDLILDMDQEKVLFPVEFLQEAGRRGLLGSRYPKRWGGRDTDWVTTCMAAEEVGTLGLIFGCLFGVGSEVVGEGLFRHGTDAQRDKYLAPMIAGTKVGAECLTEPRGGSDLFGATTTAEDRGDHYVLNGQKRFIVGAEGADHFLVYARTDNRPDTHAHKRLTTLMVERGPGVDVQYLYGLLGCRGGGTGRLVFRDVKVPKENVLGEPGGAYAVYESIMIPERLATAAMTLGAARPALDIATAYTTRRKAFGRPISQFQGVSFQIAEAVMLLDAARALVYTTARAVDSGQDPARARRMASETKKFATETAQKVVHTAMQVVGGIGYTNVFPLERMYRDMRLASIWTGTNEIMSTIIGHEWYRESGAAPALRDYEADAVNADAADEKVYE
ncbi:MAG: acyl-CoA dehydrogenase family protein [Actinomycetota bacterium]